MGDSEQQPVSLTDVLQALPIFPLPGTVFFPNTLLPLHIFEPRYRQMTEDVLAGHQHLAVTLITRDATAAAPAGCASTAGLGRVVYHERLADGRFHILLQGIARVHLREELPMGDRLYRRVRAELMEAVTLPGTEDAVAEQVHRLRSCYARLSNAHPECKDTLGDLPLRLDQPAVLADLIVAALLEDVGERQQVLEERCLIKRLERANDALATALLRTAEADVLH